MKTSSQAILARPTHALYSWAKRKRYIRANREQKSKILDEFCATYECHRSRKVAELLKLRKQLDPIALSKTPKPSTHRPGKLASYSDEPFEGPPHVPNFGSVTQHYELVLEREKRLQTV